MDNRHIKNSPVFNLLFSAISNHYQHPDQEWSLDLSQYSPEQIMDALDQIIPSADHGTLLHYAIGLPEVITYLLNLGAQQRLNAKNKLPLPLAVHQGQWDTVSAFINFDLKKSPQLSKESQHWISKENNYGWVLCAAIVSDNLDIIKLLLEGGITVGHYYYSTDNITYSVMELAVRLGKLEIIELLQKYNIPNPNSILHLAVQGSAPESPNILKLLLLQGANLTHVKADKTPISLAASIRAWQKVKLIAETRNNEQGAEYESALYDVIATPTVPYRHDLVLALLKANTSPNPAYFRIKTGYFPMHIAAQNNDAETIQLLCAYGANPQIQSKQIDKKTQVKTPDYVAFEHNSFAAFEALMQHIAMQQHPQTDTISLMLEFINANQALVTRKDSLALHWAVRQRHYRVLDRLLELAKHENLEQVDMQGKIPLALAIDMKDWQFIQVFASMKIRPRNSQYNNLFALALVKAAEAQELNVMQYLLANTKPSLHYTDRETDSKAIDWAIKHGNIEMINLLLQHGAIVYQTLPLAAKYGNIETVELLLQQPINLTHLDQHKESAFQIAVNLQRWHIADRILQAQLAAKTPAAELKLALLYLVQNNRFDQVKILLDLKTPLTELAVDDYCVGDWMFHMQEPAIDVAQLIFQQSPPIEIWKFIAKCYDLIEQGQAPAWLSQGEILKTIFPDLELCHHQDLRQEALNFLLLAVQQQSRKALHYLETELAAPNKRNDRNAQIALANLYMRGEGKLITKDLQRVAYWAFQNHKLDSAGENFFREQEVRSQLTSSQIITLYLHNFYREDDLVFESHYGLLQDITNEDIDREFITQPNLWTNRLDFIFEIFEKETTQAMLSEREKADFLLYAMLNYPTHKKICSDFAKYIAQLTDTELAAGLTNTLFIQTLLNNENASINVFAYLKLLTAKLASQILSQFTKHYPDKTIQHVNHILNLYLPIIHNANAPLKVTDLNAAAHVFNLIDANPEIENKLALKSALRTAAFAQLKATLGFYEPAERLHLLRELKEKNIIKQNLEPVQTSYYFFSSQTKTPPELQEIEEIINLIESNTAAMLANNTAKG